ncbi:MAG: hypothetical protein Q9196_004651 [Gyalolechia fulgens]
MERRYEQVTSQVQAHSQEVLARLVPPARPRSTPTTQTESQQTALATAGPAQNSGFQFNPLTAVHGEFQPGAAFWRRDQRSRRVRAIERDGSRIAEAERNAEEWARQHPAGVARSALRPDAPNFMPERGSRRAAGWSLRRGGGGRTSSRGSGDRGAPGRGGPSRGPR